MSLIRSLFCFAGMLMALACAPNVAEAQTKIVAACGTNSPGNYPIAAIGLPLTMDVNGVLCTASGGGGGGGNVNLTQILGAAPSATNPLWVSPATGSTWASTSADCANVTQGCIADALVAPGLAGTVSGKLRGMTSTLDAILQALGTSGGVLPYPIGAVPITASATGTTAATTATLAASVSGKTTYICGYSIRANATATTTVTDTLTNVITGTMSSVLWVPANTSGLGVDEQIFSPCIPASAANTTINAVSGAPGTGGVVSVKAWGYQL